MSPRQLGKKPVGLRAGTNQPTQHNKDNKVHKGSKVHKRSRDGCFTCRLRRKKCSETRPVCIACVSLGIACEYDQPDWWLPLAVREEHLEKIAQQIKDNKVACKPTKALKTQASSRARSKTSGDLFRAPSLPVLAPDLFFDEPLGFSQSSFYTPEATPSSRASGTPAYHLYYHLPIMQDPDFLCNTLDFDNIVVADASSEYPDLVEGSNGQQFCASTALPFQYNAGSSFMSQDFATSSVDNGQQASSSTTLPFRDNAGSTFMSQDFTTNEASVATTLPLRDNAPSSFTSHQFTANDINSFTPFDNNMLLPAFNEHDTGLNGNSIAPFENETQLIGNDFDAPSQFFSEDDLLWTDPSELGQFQSSYDTPDLEVSVTDANSIVPAGDQPYLDHFLQHFALFPVFDICTSGTVASNVVLPAMSSSYTVLQNALAVAAIHKRAQNGLATGDVTQDIYRFRTNTIRSMMRSCTDGTEPQDVFQSILLSIYMQTMISSVTNDLPDRAWHLQLGDHAHSIYESWTDMTDRAQALQPLNTAIAFWIDIQGAVLRRTVPLFLTTYGQALEEGAAAGMGEVIGCDDHVMFTIAEIADLDASLPNTVLEPGTAAFTSCWGRIDELMEQLHLGTQHGGNVLTKGPVSPSAMSLRSTVTTMYRLVAEIYLISLQPNSNPLEDPLSTRLFDLVETFASLMKSIPDGPDGLDSSLTWLYLIAGSYSQPKSTFRVLFMSRFDQIGVKAHLGNLVIVKNILMDVWNDNDASMMDGTRIFRHWRDVMRENRHGRDWSDVLFL